MQDLIQRIGTDEDCAMSGCHSIRYFSEPGDWRIQGFIGFTGDGYKVSWRNDHDRFNSATDAVAYIEFMSGYRIPPSL